MRVVVLNHVKVLDLAGGPAREDMAVVIRGSRIAEVSRANTVAVPSGAEVLDLSGKVALPGLADMHHRLGTGASMPGPPGPGQEVTREEPRNLAQMLAWGFTTIFSTSNPNPDIEEFVSLRQQADEDCSADATLLRRRRGDLRSGRSCLPAAVCQLLADVRGRGGCGRSCAACGRSGRDQIDLRRSGACRTAAGSRDADCDHVSHH